jgi:hypothetical protein
MEKEITVEFELRFKEFKKDLGFKSSLNKIDEIFLLRDSFSEEGHIGLDMYRAVSRKIVDVYTHWANQLHGLIIPNPSSMISVTQNSMFSESDRDEMIIVLNKMLALTSRNSVIILERNKKEEAKFIDDSVKYWNKELGPLMKKVSKKIQRSWEKKASEK